MNDLEGRCYCGKVKYKIGRPLEFLVHDHCSICRKISGAAFVTWGGTKAEQFQVIEGEEFFTVFKSTTEAERWFCKICGSHLFFRSTRWPGQVHFTMSTIITPFEEKPTAHVFYADKVPWLDLEDDLPKKEVT